MKQPAMKIQFVNLLIWGIVLSPLRAINCVLCSSIALSLVLSAIQLVRCRVNYGGRANIYVIGTHTFTC